MRRQRIDIDVFFFFNDTATTEIYTLSLHDALPIFRDQLHAWDREGYGRFPICMAKTQYSFSTDPNLRGADRKSTRLNSSHANISYAVFCLKKKNTHTFSHSLHRLPYLPPPTTHLLS